MFMCRVSIMVMFLTVVQLVYATKSLRAFSGTTPTIDGVIGVSEWADATAFGNVATWDPNFAPVLPANPTDLNISGWVKHDDSRLYFAFNVTDDILYGFQTEAWLPGGNPSANNLTRDGWPWFGDELEILINANNSWSSVNQTVTGDGRSWQMVMNLHKSRLGGIGVGGLLEGEPRSSTAAWATYQKWIVSRAMEGATSRNGQVYSFEWAINFDPCLELRAGVFYTPTMPVTTVGLNIALGDTDTSEEGDPVYGLRHEMWWNGSTGCNQGGNCYTYLYQFGLLHLEPGPKPQ